MSHFSLLRGASFFSLTTKEQPHACPKEAAELCRGSRAAPDPPDSSCCSGFTSVADLSPPQGLCGQTGRFLGVLRCSKKGLEGKSLLGDC